MPGSIAEDIVAKLKERAAATVGEISLDTELSELGIHSLELTEIVFDLEEQHGIEIEMNTVEAWSNLKNVGDLVRAVQRLVDAKAAQTGA